MEDVNLTELVREVMAELENEMTGRTVQVQIQELPPCHADQALMKQVFSNLIGNALKYTRYREDALVEIGAYLQNNHPVYYVKDNGAGFNMEYAGKLFGVFQRLHRQDEFEGTGVGLAIVQRIIHRHSGRIWAEAEEDRGATFYFTVGSSS
jgi:light-regulated signal transduction histidine kinase (bacteriophytochrome)